MSRIGKKPITITDKVKVIYEGNIFRAKGPKGELQMNIPPEIEYKFENGIITFSRSTDEKRIRALHGLTRALANNIVEGVTNGFVRNLQIEGVGYKVEMKGKHLMLSLGFSHPVLFIAPEGVQIAAPTATSIQLTGIDKQLVGEAAAKIRKLRPPEPYKGKGIRYQGEIVRRKAGKTTSK